MYTKCKEGSDEKTKRRIIMVKRSLSMLLCAAMLFSATPVQAYASTEQNTTKEEQTQTSVKVTSELGLLKNDDVTNLSKTDADSISFLNETVHTPSMASTKVASGTCGDNLSWKLDSDGVLVISGTGAMQDYSMGDAPWYSHQLDITRVVIGSGVTSIGEYAFYDCIRLTSIDLPDGVTNIGSSAFEGCSSLTSVDLPDGVTSIGSDAFFGCSSLRSITLPDGVTSIGSYAFYDCSNLSSIELPDGVTNIGNSAFKGCK